MDIINKCICDVCCEKPAGHKFKIKQWKIKNYEFGTFGYMPIDICENCYHKLLNLKQEIDLEKRVLEYVVGDEHMKKYDDDIGLQCAYLEGFDAALRLLNHKKVARMK